MIFWPITVIGLLYRAYASRMQSGLLSPVFARFNTSKGKRLRMFMTAYYIRPLRGGEYPLVNASGNVIAYINQSDYQSLLMEGTGRLPDGRIVNYAGRSGGSHYWSTLPASSNGIGTGGRRLTPFKSVAVDKSVIPIGSKLKIEGLDITVVADDVGGAIKGNRIDFFVGDDVNFYNRWTNKYVDVVIV